MEKLFVLIRDELAPAHQAVQGGHAVAQWMLEHPEPSWNNGILVYLRVKNMPLWYHKLQKFGYDYSEFREPDMGNIITAIAVQGPDETFSKLQLI
jgi:hypothetical protein